MTDLLDCGHSKSPRRHAWKPATGLDGKRYCYACCAEADRKQMRAARLGDVFCAYVSSDGKTLTTWPGEKLGTVKMGNRHPWSRERRYIRVVDLDGGKWYGTGAEGMLAHLRKAK